MILAETPAVIEVRSVSHGFARKAGEPVQPVLADVSLSIPEGELVCFLGPSGCGKSTLLNMIGGFINPRSGQLLIDSAPVRGVQPRRIAFVFQENTLFPWDTVEGNLNVALEFAAVRGQDRAPRVAQALAAVGMGDFASYYPSQLSGGMKQRVALARALCLETDILLMDEPFAALDEQTRMVLGEDLSVLLARTKKTIVLVTHSLNEAVFLSDRVFVMTARPGRIKSVVKIDKPHPRTPEFMISDEFNAVRKQLYELLHDEIRQSLDHVQKATT